MLPCHDIRSVRTIFSLPREIVSSGYAGALQVQAVIGNATPSFPSSEKCRRPLSRHDDRWDPGSTVGEKKTLIRQSPTPVAFT